jgi:hypothetical protein
MDDIIKIHFPSKSEESGHFFDPNGGVDGNQNNFKLSVSIALFLYYKIRVIQILPLKRHHT